MGLFKNKKTAKVMVEEPNEDFEEESEEIEDSDAEDLVEEIDPSRKPKKNTQNLSNEEKYPSQKEIKEWMENIEFRLQMIERHGIFIGIG